MIWPVLFGLPILFLILRSFEAEPEVLNSFWNNLFPEVAFNSFVLGPSIAVIALLFGGVWGFIFARYEFPLKRALAIAFVAPLTIPVYVYSFVYLGIWSELGFTSKPIWLFVMVFVFASFPYTFLISRQAFSFEDKALTETSKLMGLSSWEHFWKVQWPLKRALILSGFFIVLSEYYSDYGAVSAFGINSFSTAVFKLWIDYKSLASAALVSLGFLVIILAMLYAQSRIKSHASLHDRINTKPTTYGYLITSLAVLVVLLSVAIPVGQLVLWSIRSTNTAQFMGPLFNTVILALTFALAMTAFSVFAVYLVDRKKETLTQILQFGYALPGTLLAVAVGVPFFYLQRFFDGFSRNAFFAIAILFYAWFIRFFKVSWDPIRKHRLSSSVSLEDAALVFGESPRIRWMKIRLPTMKAPLLVAFLLAFLEASKELPIVLLNRPFGWDTLSVKIFEYTSESDWISAAPMALTLVLLGVLVLRTTNVKS
jgi:iron(III) transport system permease protein